MGCMSSQREPANIGPPEGCQMLQVYFTTPTTPGGTLGGETPEGSPGRMIRNSETIAKPTCSFTPTLIHKPPDNGVDDLFTVGIFDTDGANPKKPKARADYLHLLRVNCICPNLTDSGEEIAPYEALAPPVGTHKYFVRVWRQKRRITMDEYNFEGAKKSGSDSAKEHTPKNKRKSKIFPSSRAAKDAADLRKSSSSDTDEGLFTSRENFDWKNLAAKKDFLELEASMWFRVDGPPPKTLLRRLSSLGSETLQRMS